MSFSRETELAVTCIVTGARAASSLSWQVVNGQVSINGLIGQGALPPDAHHEGTSPRFFHGTTVGNGLLILQSGAFEASVGAKPAGVYTCCEPLSCAAYNKGCIIQLSSVSLVLSLKESDGLQDQAVPEGYVACKHRPYNDTLY